MALVDWIVLLSTLFLIVGFGVYKTRKQKNIQSYFGGSDKVKWYTIGLSVMATQASAITLLSTPGQGYADGMGFVQFYFGLPLAMLIICLVFLPKYMSLKVYTAYEFLEERFDLKTRTLTAILFLIQRGLAAGITIYAPAIILSSVLGWSLTFTNLLIGILVIIYTVSGGTQAVTQTQKQQMLVILTGMAIAFTLILNMLPDDLSFSNALQYAGMYGKTKVIETEFSFSNRYNIWSGLTGGLFLALSYFGTDQSQVSRYLSSTSLKQSRMGLIFNGIVKIPMQFLILLTGVLVFTFYQFEKAPMFFNTAAVEQITSAEGKAAIAEKQAQFDAHFEEKSVLNKTLVSALNNGESTIAYKEQIEVQQAKEAALRGEVKDIVSQYNPEAETNDTDYVFLRFVLDYLPHGIIGLLLAVIFSAAMSSTASEINALASTTVIDLYKRNKKKELTETEQLKTSKLFTVAWGFIAIGFALTASLFENLIQAVNILGSLFYGTILGVFMVAFFLKFIKGNAVFIAALLAETMVITLFKTSDLGFLWYNVIGCFAVVIFALIIQGLTLLKRA